MRPSILAFALGSVVFVFVSGGACSSSDPCAAFAGQTCITLEARGGVKVDQIRLDSIELQIVDGLSPPSPGRLLGLPVQLAVVPADRNFAGPFHLDATGLRGGAAVGSDVLSATFVVREHRRLVADLGGVGSDGGTVDFAQAPPDLLGLDLLGVDLATVDLAVADLATVDLAGADLSQPTGPHWVSQSTPLQPNTLWASGPSDLWATGFTGTLMRSTGDGHWRKEVTGAAQQVFAVWGSGPTDLYAAGGTSQAFLAHSTGDGSWTPQTVPADVVELFGVGGADSTHIWATGDNTVLRRSGSSWVHETTGVPNFFIYNVLATSATDVWAVTAGMTILHSAGDGVWSSQPLGGVNAQQMWGTNSSSCLTPPCGDFWAPATGADRLLHSAGDGTWSDAPVAPSTIEDLFSVGGIGPTEVYVGGGNGFIARFDGSQWTQEPTDLPQGGTGARIGSIFAVAPGNAYAVAGSGNVILHRVPN